MHAPKFGSARMTLWVAVLALVPAKFSTRLAAADPAVNPGPLTNITSVGNAALISDTQPPLLAAPPMPQGLNQFVQDRAALLRLGKALFWDMQVGSDGVQSCASCHFHGGADNRIKNQVSPGIKVTPVPDTTFQLGQGPNYTLKASDFPLSTNQNQNDVVSSQGVISSAATDDSGFSVGGIKVRRVEPRNAPTVINAAFNRLQFWDGRAKDEFNGVTPFGPNPAGSYPQVHRAENPDADWSNFDVIQDGGLDQASLASIAVGPVLSLFEMTGFNRTFVDLHFSFRSSTCVVEDAVPLAGQWVATNDSVLGSYSAYPETGLNVPNYARMIQDAYKSEWWNSKLQPGGFTLMEENLSLFWGLALREYMATLISDSGLGAHTPFDRYQAGDLSALTQRQIEGLQIFVNTTAKGGANCSTCHTLPEFTRASTRRSLEQELLPSGAISRNSQVKQNGWITDYGVRLPGDDPGAGDDSTFPDPPAGDDAAHTLPNTFKTPTVRNIALTAPYMHNGRFSTLEQVVDFYNEGRRDGVTNRGPQLNLTSHQKEALVDFMRYGLTDDRVLFERAPFDHPQLIIPNGERGDDVSLPTNSQGNAIDEYLEIPAVGATGLASPISAVNFEVNLQAQPDPFASSVAIDDSLTFTYSAVAQGPTHAVTTGSTGAISFTYASSDGITYPPTSAQPTNAGTYVATAFVAADATHAAASSTPVSFEIHAAPLTITAIPIVKLFGTEVLLGSGQSGFTAMGLLNGETVGSVSLTSSGGTVATDAVGSYLLTPSDATGGTFSADNYAITYVPSTLSESPAPTTILITGATVYPYTGTPEGPTHADVVGSTGDASFTYASRDGITYPATSALPTDPGTYVATATVAADGNHLSAMSDGFSFSISVPVSESSDVPLMPPWGFLALTLGVVGVGRKAFQR